MPFWDEAIRTERRTGAKVRSYAATEHPPVLRDAVALQGFEEIQTSANTVVSSGEKIRNRARIMADEVDKRLSALAKHIGLLHDLIGEGEA